MRLSEQLYDKVSSPYGAYQEALSRRQIEADPSQAKAIEALEDLFWAILKTSDAESKGSIRGAQRPSMPCALLSWLQRLWRRCIPLNWLQRQVCQGFRGHGRSEGSTPKGLYLYGGVGRGKTYLMDLFFDALPIQDKHRIHFYAFMANIHEGLRELKGHANPLQLLAKQVRQHYRVLCLDEMFVNDIADAMILGELLKALFREGIIWVTTSNVPPDQLYADGIQRDRFLSAIQWINAHTLTVNVDSGIDYRDHSDQHSARFQWVSSSSSRWLQRCFQQLSEGRCPEPSVLRVQDRDLPVLGTHGSVLWIDFNTLCGPGRSQQDYLYLASQYQAILISDVPQLTGEDDDQARRWIALIDILYDQKADLYITADVSIQDMYIGRRLAFEFERTQSRLTEMLFSEASKTNL